jgi:uncharacterized C2H2 Zn-finger protein
MEEDHTLTTSPVASTSLGNRRLPGSSRESTLPTAPTASAEHTEWLVTHYNRDNSIFLCHRCLHTFHRMEDIKRHLSRDNRCVSTYTCFFNDKEISTNSLRRYCFCGVTKAPTLTNNQKIYLIHNHTEDLNYITLDSLKYDINTDMYGNESSKRLIDNTTDRVDKQKSESIDVNKFDKHIEACIITVSGKEKYKCPHCTTVYDHKSSLIRHIKKGTTCKARSKVIKLLEHPLYAESDKSHDAKVSSSSGGSYNINTNISNVNQTQNNNNTYNNTYNSMCKVQVLDFFKENFKYTHIPNGIVEDPNSMSMERILCEIMKDDVNKNIYFDKDHAFVYMNGSVERLTKEKGVYFLMVKLDDTIGSFIRTNSLITDKDEYKPIIWYYDVEKRKYVHDTVYKEFDFEKMEYKNTNSSHIRTRDYHITTLCKVMNHVKDRTYEVLSVTIKDRGVIDSNLDIDIPNFASRRLRNKDLKDDY